MTQKITISVPDDLHEEMQQWKDSFNYSGLFQDAISKEIQKRENFQDRLKEDPSINEIIERLKEEKIESTQKYFDKGKIAGMKWAKASHYDEIQFALRFAKEWQYDYPIINKNDKGIWVEYWKEIMKNDGYFNEDGYRRSNSNLNRFVHGWTTGILEFWDEVKNKIDIYP